MTCQFNMNLYLGTVLLTGYKTVCIENEMPFVYTMGYMSRVVLPSINVCLSISLFKIIMCGGLGWEILKQTHASITYTRHIQLSFPKTGFLQLETRNRDRSIIKDAIPTGFR